MKPQFARVREIADRFRVSADAIYQWIRQGKIPSECVVRSGCITCVVVEQFERLLRAGVLYQARGRKPAVKSDTGAEDAVSPLARDNFTTTRSGPCIEHAWTDEGFYVRPQHPFCPEMRATVK